MKAPSVKQLNEERVAIRRVLHLTIRFLKRQKADLLVTDGKGLMTWGEIVAHLDAAAHSQLLRTKPRWPSRRREWDVTHRLITTRRWSR